MDAITKACARLDYARDCVMLDYMSTLPKHLAIMSPHLIDGGQLPCKIDIKYKWIPQRCIKCKILGRVVSMCPLLKKAGGGQVPVAVYEKKISQHLSLTRVRWQLIVMVSVLTRLLTLTLLVNRENEFQPHKI
ncbi:UNVERIFIED_CONTAM: hypothetical protein Slati_3875800 [Sesamum latifolium]|uniref:Uncharacterized protein n=1 Tax=Sesamum latifolium TaxID=2727402 RepID=A0AAW2TMI3_9LAMI